MATEEWSLGYMAGVEACALETAEAAPASQGVLSIEQEDELHRAIGELSFAMGCPATGGGFPKTTSSETVRLAIDRLKPATPSGAPEGQDEFERGRQQGIQQERALWELAAEGQKMDAPEGQGVPTHLQSKFNSIVSGYRINAEDASWLFAAIADPQPPAGAVDELRSIVAKMRADVTAIGGMENGMIAISSEGIRGYISQLEIAIDRSSTQPWEHDVK